MIKVLIGQKGKLVRGAIATLLSRTQDIKVTAELSHSDDVLSTAHRESVDIAILDAQLPGATPVSELCEKLTPQCRILILSDPEAPGNVCASLAHLAPRVGFVATESSPDMLIDNIRRASRGEVVFDISLALAALTEHNPLTDRERQVLRLAAEGMSAPEIGLQLFLSPGTVRNHLSRIMTKIDCRTRIAAIHKAQRKGWI